VFSSGLMDFSCGFMVFSWGFMVLSSGFMMLSSGFVVFGCGLVMFGSWFVVFRCRFMVFSGGLMDLSCVLVVFSSVFVMFIIMLFVGGVLLNWLIINLHSFLMRLFLVSNRFFMHGRLGQDFLTILVGINVMLLSMILIMCGFFVVCGFLMMRWFLMMANFVLANFSMADLVMANLMMMSWLFMHNDMLNSFRLHSLGELCTFNELLGLLKNSLVFSLDDLGVFLLKVYADLVVDEGKDHAVMDWDQVRWLMLGVLAGALHEDKCAVCRHLVLTLFGNEPPLLVGIGNIAVVCRDCLELDLDLTLHGAADREVVLGECLQNNLFLNEILVFIGADPGWAGSKGGRILRGRIFDVIVLITGAHNIKRAAWLLARLLGMGHLVKVVVDDLTQIDQGVLLNLNFSLFINLDA